MPRLIERMMSLTLKAQSQAETVLQRAGGAMEGFVNTVKEAGFSIPILGRRTFLSLTALAETSRQLSEAQREVASSVHISEGEWRKYEVTANMAGKSERAFIDFHQTLNALYADFRKNQSLNIEAMLYESGVMKQSGDIISGREKMFIRLSHIYDQFAQAGKQLNFWTTDLGKTFEGLAPLLEMGADNLEKFLQEAKKVVGATPKESLKEYQDMTYQTALLKVETQKLGYTAGLIVYPALIKLVRVMREWLEVGGKILSVFVFPLRILYSVIVWLWEKIIVLRIAFKALFAAFDIGIMVVTIVFFTRLVSWVVRVTGVLKIFAVVIKAVVAGFSFGGVVGVLAAIVALIASLVLGWKGLGWIVEKVSGLTDIWANKEKRRMGDKIGAQEDYNKLLTDEGRLMATTVDMMGVVTDTFINFIDRVAPPLLEVIRQQNQIAKGLRQGPGRIPGAIYGGGAWALERYNQQ